MDKATVDSIKATIENVGGTLGGIVDAVDPQFHVPIVIGTAIAAQAPELVKDVEDWIAGIKSGTPPTVEQNAAVAAKIIALLSPEGPDLA